MKAASRGQGGSVATYVCTYIHTYIQTYRQTDIQTDRHTDRQTDTQTDRETDTRTHAHTGNFHWLAYTSICIENHTFRKCNVTSLQLKAIQVRFLYNTLVSTQCMKCRSCTHAHTYTYTYNVSACILVVQQMQFVEVVTRVSDGPQQAPTHSMILNELNQAEPAATYPSLLSQPQGLLWMVEAHNHGSPKSHQSTLRQSRRLCHKVTIDKAFPSPRVKGDHSVTVLYSAVTLSNVRCLQN